MYYFYLFHIISIVNVLPNLLEASFSALILSRILCNTSCLDILLTTNLNLNRLNHYGNKKGLCCIYALVICYLSHDEINTIFSAYLVHYQYFGLILALYNFIYMPKFPDLKIIAIVEQNYEILILSLFFQAYFKIFCNANFLLKPIRIPQYRFPDKNSPTLRLPNWCILI